VDARPAGFSEKWLTFILRGQLGFGGAIFSDDLSMAGARIIDGKEVSYSQAAMAALNAGCDMVLLCNQSVDEGKAVDELLDGMAEGLVKGQWEALESSEMRRLDLLPVTRAPRWDELMLHPAYMHAMGLVS
jgi:beta-N-acetylhexosaminidase